MPPSLTRRIRLLGLVGIGAASVFWLSSRELRVTEPSVLHPTRAPGPAVPVVPLPLPIQAAPALAPVDSRPVKGYQPLPETGPDAEALTRIEAAAVSYSPVGVTTLAPFLLHSSPAVRERAVDAFIRLGETGGAIVLRDAAAKIKDPREAVKMLDAADYLELPPAKDLSKFKSKKHKPSASVSKEHNVSPAK